MGGPLWTAEEEEYFWNVVIPNSDKRIGHDMRTQRDQVKTWEQLAEEMKKAMRAIRARQGRAPLRDYTHLTLTEHFDKNVMQNRISKHAGRHVQAYLRDMEEHDKSRWARREKRMSGKTSEKRGKRGKKAGGDNGDDDDDDDDESDDDDTQPQPKKQKVKVVSGAGRTMLPGIGSLLSESRGRLAGSDPSHAHYSTVRHPGSGRGPTARRLFPGPDSRPIDLTGDDTYGQWHGPGGQPRRDLSDNGYMPRRELRVPPPSDEPQEWVTRAEAQIMVDRAVDQTRAEMGRMVEDAVRQRLQDAVAARLQAIGDLVQGDVTQMVRQEVDRQLAFHRDPSMGRSDQDHRRDGPAGGAFQQRTVFPTAMQAMDVSRARGPIQSPTPLAQEHRHQSRGPHHGSSATGHVQPPAQQAFNGPDTPPRLLPLRSSPRLPLNHRFSLRPATPARRDTPAMSVQTGRGQSSVSPARSTIVVGSPRPDSADNGAESDREVKIKARASSSPPQGADSVDRRQ